MTGTRRVERGRGHSYLLDGEKVPGVTTLISNGLPKPALTTWAANTAAAHAVDHWDELTHLPISERLKRISKAPWGERDAAAVRGTEVHHLAERLGDGEQVEVPDHLTGHVDACVRFLDEWHVEPVLAERPVFNRRVRYAGTFDLIADIADGRRLLIDYKTNKSGPFGEVALQLAAYRYADFYLDEEDFEQPLPEVDGCAVAWIRSDGYDLIPFDAGPAEFRAFQYVAQVAAFAAIAKDLKGDALTPPALKETA